MSIKSLKHQEKNDMLPLKEQKYRELTFQQKL